MKRTLLFINQLLCLIITLSILLVGCSTNTAPPSEPGVKMPWKKREHGLAQIHAWNLNGKIGVQTPKDSGSASVQWTQSSSNYTLSLSGPLGAGGMVLKGHPGAVSLTTSDGKTFTADSAEDLLAKNWGYKLPVSYLKYWVRGMPVPNIASKTSFDQYNRLNSMQQQGWNVQYEGYTRTSLGDLPNKMIITSPSMRVKVIISSWQVS